MCFSLENSPNIGRVLLHVDCQPSLRFKWRAICFLCIIFTCTHKLESWVHSFFWLQKKKKKRESTDEFRGVWCPMISLMAPLTGRPLCGGQLAFSSLLLPPPSHPTRRAERMTQWGKGHLYSRAFKSDLFKHAGIHTDARGKLFV